MPEIKVLSREIAELIAAGEVVERPASVIKELTENSVDAGADRITVEIQRGGITYLRVTDNGCGIAHNEVPTAFLRHATSKIKSEDDLSAIGTLGFRGEALAAVSSVARVEMLTRPHGADIGTRYVTEGGIETAYEEIGCPEGTTLVIRDIFFNTPARMKFLKKDVSEANAAAAVFERIALSHPEIAFKLIRDGKQVISTPGDGKLAGAVYSVLGRDFAASLTEVNGITDGISVKGLTCKPIACRPTRNYQLVFLNGRFVRSGTVTAAAEQAYKNSAMVGKFPGFVLYITVPPSTVDVNVHPAKTEVRFSDERRIFDAVYSAVKNALAAGDTRPEIQLKKPEFNPFERVTAAEYRQQAVKDITPAEKIYGVSRSVAPTDRMVFRDANYGRADKEKTVYVPQEIVCPPLQASPPAAKTPAATDPKNISYEKPATENAEIEKNTAEASPEVSEPLTLIGEAFSTYVIVQKGESLFVLDKHAAHERILFNKLKSESRTEIQILLTAVTVPLSPEEYDAVVNNLSLLSEAGFEAEDFGNFSVRVTAVPAMLTRENIPSLISELADRIMKNSSAENSRLDEIYHTVACRAAVKAGDSASRLELSELAKQVLSSNEIMYCPHGRPVAFEIKRRELERRFGRLQ